ncbi:radical SAM protein [Gammaproteobacteria bacterium]|nr:radical SAM protein [Gammaproteobacteria bacterium]
MGSSLLSDDTRGYQFNPTDYSVKNMSSNKSYKYRLESEGGDPQGKILEEMQDRYRWYRDRWLKQPKDCIDQKINNSTLIESGNIPLCIDIETAAICDLACPFCYREYIATPDKVMSVRLAKKLIKQASDIGVPSIKFNWRGEPLLNPKITELIDYAKRHNILETMINTNATTLTKKKSEALINSGLDVMIYSFDGGSKETYEKNRPGRFKKNRFDDIYKKIKGFHEVRTSMGSKFPRTKIQMILTEDTFNEQESFFELFSEYVDEVVVNQYTERGGSLSELSNDEITRYEKAMKDEGSKENLPFMRGSDGKMWISLKRKPCEQPYQRLMVTYDGRVGMCCHDWGSKHPVGFTSDESFEDPDKEYKEVIRRVEIGKSGFELLENVKMPKTYNYPEEKVTSIHEIWIGEEINKVRDSHQNDMVEDVEICKGCSFKDTYDWVEI